MLDKLKIKMMKAKIGANNQKNKLLYKTKEIETLKSNKNNKINNKYNQTKFLMNHHGTFNKKIISLNLQLNLNRYNHQEEQAVEIEVLLIINNKRHKINQI